MIVIRPLVATLVAAVLFTGCTEKTPAEETAPLQSAAPVATPPPDAAPVPPRDTNTPPPVRIEPEKLDFGILAPGGVGEGSATIFNTGSAPLTIVRSITSCGCTEAEDLAGRVIEPGGSTTFGTTMNMKSGLGKKMEKITIWFAGHEKRPVIYYFHAEVSLPVRATPPHLTAATDQGPILTGTVTIESRDGRPFNVLACDGRPPVFVEFDPAIDTPLNRYSLRWDLTEQDSTDTVPWWWIVETDHPDAAMVDLRVRHMATRPPRPGPQWVPKDQRVILGAIQPGRPVEAKAKIEYRPNYAPDPSTATVAATADQPFTVELIDAKVDGQFIDFRFRITPTQTTPGLLSGQMLFGASGQSSPLRVYGSVR